MTYCTGTTAREANKDNGPEVNVTMTKHMCGVSTKKHEGLAGLFTGSRLFENVNRFPILALTVVC